MVRAAHGYVVGHAGRRDYYQVAAALAAEGRLAGLATDFYCPDLLVKLAPHMPRQLVEMMLRRRTPELSSRYVSPWDEAALIVRHIERRIRRRRHRATVGRAVGERVARTVNSLGCGAIVYGYNWEGFVAAVHREEAHAPRLLFLSHPTPSQVRQLMRRDRANTNVWRDPEPEEELPEGDIESQEAAFRLADGAIVPSKLVRDGLVAIGMAPERVKVVTYGGDMSARVPTPGVSYLSGHKSRADLRLLWVGQVTYRKGPHHLARALQMLGRKDIRLTVVAYHRRGSDPFADVPGEVAWSARVADTDLPFLMEAHDALVMPSLVEGFGLVYVEALHAGLPVIATPNSGAPDIVRDGVNGLIVEAGDVEGLACAIDRLADDRGLRSVLRDGAYRTGRRWTWARFRSGVVAAIDELEAV